MWLFPQNIRIFAGVIKKSLNFFLMETGKLERQLQLLLLLIQNDRYTIDDICEKLSMSRRSFYRNLHALRNVGILVKKHRNLFSIDQSTPFIKKLIRGISFSEEEVLALSQVLNSVLDNSVMVRLLREKLNRLYNPHLLAAHSVSDQLAENIGALYQCMREHRLAFIQNYSSPSSGKISDRWVEPYSFLNDNRDVRCFEPASQENKTFKIERMGKVTPLDLLWEHEEQHVACFSDIFHFSGEQHTNVTLILGQLSANVLLEEFPIAAGMMELLPDGRHKLVTQVCDFRGVGRFVLGLYDDVEVVSPIELKNYIRQRLETFLART